MHTFMVVTRLLVCALLAGEEAAGVLWRLRMALDARRVLEWHELPDLTPLLAQLPPRTRRAVEASLASEATRPSPPTARGPAASSRALPTQ